MREETHLARDLWDAIKGFPEFAVRYVGGLIVALLTNLHMATIALTGVAVGFAAHGVLIGVAAFFVFYTISRIVGNVAEAVGFGLKGVANQLYRDHQS